MSVCRSFGSNFLSSGQTRKVSIGILDSQQKTKYAAAKEDGATKPNAENGTYDSKVNTVANNWGSRVAGATAKTNQVPEPQSSPWISPKQVHSEVPKKFNCVKEAQGTHSVQFFSSQDSDLEYGHDKENKVNMVSRKRKAGEDGNTERVEKCSYARVHDVLESGTAFEDKTNDPILRSREALRLKLCEILGPVSSPNQQSSNSQNVKKGETNMNPENSSVQKNNTVVNPQSSNSQSLSNGAANLKPEHNSVQKHNTVVNMQSSNSQNVRKGATTLKPERIFVQKHNVVNPRQMSDPIETDSEVPNHTNKRPVTRSLSRNRAQTKVQPNKIKSGLSFNHNQKVQKSINFSAEGGSSRPHCAANSGPLSCRAKKSENKRSDIKPLEIFFPEKGSAINIQPSTERGKAHAPAEKTSSRKHRKDYLSCPPVDKMRKVELKNHCEGKYSHHSEVAKKAGQFGDLNSKEFLERVDQHEGSGKLESMSTGEQKDSISSPTFEFRVPNNEYSSDSQKAVVKEKGVSSPVSAEKRFTVEDFGFFKNVQTTTPDSYRSNLEAESTVSLIPLDVPDDAKGLKDSHTPNSISSSEERGVGDRLFKSLSEGKDYESSDDDVHMNEGYNGTVATDEFVPSEQIQEDIEDSNGSGRAVALFSIALERVKSKMKSFTAKKSSEILMSVTEAAHLQLENLSSQIQSDVAKLTSHSKSERKRLEARLQEKQEAMMQINENFKEEVNQNLQDCRSILEAMEAHQMKVKGIIKRQKASHKKLFLEVEEANKMQIDDAQRRIETVQKLAKGKMLQLQHGISECLKEGFFG